ncbi:MAG: HAD family hydrolase [Gammaproteobacteria bacterium]|nr:MAG: HAD family hydrolase [Gammaproteobacteria bacterium]
MALAALIWDVDGTLVDNEELHRQAFNAAFTAAGLDWHWDQASYRELLAVTGGRERITHFVQTRDPDRAARPGFPAFVRDLHIDKTRRYGERLDAGVSLRPGVARLIGEARDAGLPQAIATTTSRVNVERLLEGTLGREALGWFSVIASGETVTAKKPAPDLYRVALDGLGLPGASCLAIEDTSVGLRSARAAGVPTLITVSRYSSGEDFTSALAVVDRLGEPDLPSQVLHGSLHGQAYIDLSLLRIWHKENKLNKEIGNIVNAI